MSRRFFVEVPIAGESAILSGPEAQHLSKVMRARVGDEVTLFDGIGSEFTARVDRIERSSVELCVIRRHEVNRELPFELTMGVALPKGERQQWLTEKLTELGVTRLVPLTTARGVAQPNDNTVVRLKRAVIEASKQCGRNRLMEIGSPQSFADFVSNQSRASQRLLVHPGEAATGPAHPFDFRGCGGESIVVVIGPEGGFDQSELQIATQCNWQSVELGSRILRVETAAIAVAATMVIRRGW